MNARRLAILALVATSPALADFVPFAGPLATTQPQFLAAAGAVGTVNFETFLSGGTVGALPGVAAAFAPEYADGSPAPLPVISPASPVSTPNWTVNTGNNRPAWSSWVIRPNAGQSIYAFGHANAEGDTVRINAYNAAGALVGSVDAQAATPGFVGFVSSTPIARIVVTPLGNVDGRNGMDNLQIGTTPIPSACYANCDSSASAPVLNVQDFTCFLQRYAAGNGYANCDGSTSAPALNVSDFTCFLQRYAAGCQ
jgi:hypothetical protein